MNALAAHIVDSLLEDEQFEQIEETNNPVASEESMGIGHAMNDFDFILTTDKRSV